MSTYTNNAQQRICLLIEELAGHEIEGRSLNSLSKSLGQSTGQTFRDLKNLEEIGWARQDEKSLWLMTEKAAHPAVKIQRNLQTVMGAVNKINKDYLGGNV